MSMMLLLWLLPDVLGVLLLLVATREPRFLGSRMITELAAGVLIAATPFLFVTPLSWPVTAVMAVAQLFLLLLPARILFGRLDKPFVFASTRLNALWLIGLMLIVTGVWWLGAQTGRSSNQEWRLVVVMLAVVAMQLVFLAHNIWTFKHYKPRLPATAIPNKDLPTVSICIPARNETHVLEDCLTNVLASSYQKLEVLVLDDCSQDKTSQIIRSFAHDGVRFIQGDAPANGWLGRNQALQTLAEQATGDYILFMDVDTRLSVPTVNNLVQYALAANAKMVTVLPQNRLGLLPGSLLGNLHYFWQMVLPITRKHAPVAKQAWLINADTLRKLGGFQSVSHKIIPEESFARRLFDEGAYRFVAGTPELGITTAKRWSSQVESSVRELYPTFKRQPIYALSAAVYTAVVFVAPLLLAVWLLVTDSFNGLCVLALTAFGLGLINYGLVLVRTHPRAWWLAMFLLPLNALQEVILLFVSLVQYEFGEVNWKGRNVCYPVISSLAQSRPEPAPLPKRDRS